MEREIRRSTDSTPLVSKGKNYLLTIGIDQYNDTAIPLLQNAVKDIETLENVLTQHYNFNLYSKLTNSQANRTAILDILEELESLTEDDNLIIFFSGHGYKKSKNGFIVPFDGKHNKTSDYISYAQLKERIEELKVHHFLLILDCCYAGSALKKMEGKAAFNKPSRRILAASSPEETAEDGYIGRNSPFTAALTEILHTNLRDELPVKTLFSDLRNLMDNKGVRQVPIEGIWQMELNRGGEFIFKKTILKEEIITDINAFERAKTSADWLAWLKQFPNSPLREAAGIQLAASLRAEQNIELGTSSAQYLEKKIAGIKLRKALQGQDVIPSEDFEQKITVQPEKVDVILENTNGNNINAAKILKNHLNLSLEEARDVVLQCPVLLCENVEKSSIAQMLKDFDEIGAKYRIEPYNKPIVEAPKPTILIPKKYDFEPDMVFVKGGTFKMGSNEGEANEKPIHDVTLSDFYIGKYPITQAQWQAVMGNNPSHFKGDNLPVESVSWDDCQGFIKKINEKTGKKYALPTEAQWEYAARGGNQSKGFKYSGSDNIEEVAWYFEKANGKTHPVGEKKANELGLYDMSGNVWEWCNDYYNNYSSVATVNPTGAAEGTPRVLRGGSWLGYAGYCRPTYRDRSTPSFRDDIIGFRLALVFPSV